MRKGGELMDKNRDMKVKDTTESLEIVDFELVEFDDIEQMEDVVNGASFGIGICCILN